MNENINTDVFRFAYENYLWALILVPVIVGIFYLATRLKKRALRNFGESSIIERLMPDASKARVIIKFSILVLSLALIIFVVARPQYGKKAREVTISSSEVVIAIDVSKSMNATDIQPNRLETAKEAVRKLLRETHDKIGLVIFAGEAMTFSPLTHDLAAVDLLLTSLSPEDIPVQGTNIADAIDLGMKSFNKEFDGGKAIIIITDGEDHEEKALEKAAEARKAGIQVSTVGMGKTAAVPIYDEQTRDFKKDKDGNKVLTKLNETLLKQIAAEGGGIYTRANNIDIGLKNVISSLSKLKKSDITVDEEDYHDQYLPLIYIILALLFIEFIISEKKNKFLRNLKLFD